jgi:HEAT repeat protein
MENLNNKIILFVFLVITFSNSFVSAQSLKEQKSFNELMKVIQTSYTEKRIQAIYELSKINDTRVVPILIQLYEDKNVSIRTNSIRYLSGLADKRGLDTLLKALNDKTGDIRRYAAGGILKIGEPKHVPALISSVLKYLPDSKTVDSESRFLELAFEAIGKLSAKAPQEIINLLNKVEDTTIIEDNNWWNVLTNVANCLGAIGDKTAYEPLQKALMSLELNYQDYKTWYAVKKALASVEAQKESFNRPAAEILNSIHSIKNTNEYERKEWIVPLSKLSDESFDDLSWILKFTKKRDTQRRAIAIKVLDEIGGQQAFNILNEFLQNQSKVSYTEYSILKSGIVSLIKINHSNATLIRIIEYSKLLPYGERGDIVIDILSIQEVPLDIKIEYYEAIYDIIPKRGQIQQILSLKQNAASSLVKFLGKQGGQEAGEYLKKMLFDPNMVTEVKPQIVEAFSTIENYDAVPILIKASGMEKYPLETIVKAMGTIKDERAIPTLKEILSRDNLTTKSRLWTVAALARFDVDYYENAKIIREELPNSLEQAQWLNDKESIDAIAIYIKDEKFSEKAVNTLVVIGTEYAYGVLISQIDLEKDVNPSIERRLCATAAKMAEKLGKYSKQYYQDAAWILQIVPQWFVVAQRPVSIGRDGVEILKRYPSLVRNTWIAVASYYLDRAAKKDAKVEQIFIPGEAFESISYYFDDDLVPILERVIKEDSQKESYLGKSRMVQHYSNRSRAAKILTDKTGREYTFIDVDGRTHPGGWNPSMEK